jgi:5,6-dimethylbenzimidazole synthase
MDKHKFSKAEIAGVYRAIAERRDMRHFINKPIPAETLTKLLQAAHQAGSVGLMQPWHFIRITSNILRQSIYQLVEIERIYSGQYKLRTAKHTQSMQWW